MLKLPQLSIATKLHGLFAAMTLIIAALAQTPDLDWEEF